MLNWFRYLPLALLLIHVGGSARAGTYALYEASAGNIKTFASQADFAADVGTLLVAVAPNGYDGFIDSTERSALFDRETGNFLSYANIDDLAANRSPALIATPHVGWEGVFGTTGLYGLYDSQSGNVLTFNSFADLVANQSGTLYTTPHVGWDGAFADRTTFGIFEKSSGSIKVFQSIADLVADSNGTIVASPHIGWDGISITEGTTTRPVGASSLLLGDILVIDNQVRRLLRIDPVSGARTLVSGAKPLGGVLGSGIDFTSLTDTGIVLEESGTILVVDNVDSNSARLLRVDPETGNRAVLSSCELGVCVGSGPVFRGAHSLVVRNDGRIFMSVGSNIAEVDPVTGDRTLVFAPTSIPGAAAMAADVDGSLVYTWGAFGIGSVARVDPDVGVPVMIASSIPASMRDVVIEADGRIVTTGTGQLIRIDPATGTWTVLSEDGVQGVGPAFQVPTGLALEDSGAILVGDQSGRILRVDPVTGDRSIASDSSSGGPSMSYPRGVEVVPQDFQAPPPLGTIYALDATTDELREIDLALGSSISIGPVGFANLRGLAFDQFTGTFFSVDEVTDELVAIDPTTGVGSLQTALEFSPFFPAVDPSRYVADLALRNGDPQIYAILVDSVSTWLVRINRVNGLVVPQFDFGVIGVTGPIGLAFSSDGSAWYLQTANAVVAFDWDTGANTGVFSAPGFADLEADPIGQPLLGAVAQSPTTTEIVGLDLNTECVTSYGTVNLALAPYGLSAFVSGQPVPEPGISMMLVFGSLGLLTIAGVKE